MVIAGTNGVLGKEGDTWGMDKEHNGIEIEGREVEDSELFQCSRRMWKQKNLGSCEGVK